MESTSASSKGGPSRFDPLAEFNRPTAPPVDFRATMRTLFAFVLLGGGIALCVWIIIAIHAALFAPEEISLLKRLTPGPEDLKITLPEGSIELPPATLTVIGYIFIVLLLAIAGKIAALLIRNGVMLLRSPAPAGESANDPRLSC